MHHSQYCHLVLTKLIKKYYLLLMFLKILNTVDIFKPMRPDGITKHLLKEVSFFLAEPHSHSVNVFLSLGVFLDV